MFFIREEILLVLQKMKIYFSMYSYSKRVLVGFNLIIYFVFIKLHNFVFLFICLYIYCLIFNHYHLYRYLLTYDAYVFNIEHFPVFTYYVGKSVLSFTNLCPILMVTPANNKICSNQIEISTRVTTLERH